jgi:hypothetical protein
VRWATLIGIFLVLFHRPHSEGPSPTDKKRYNYIEKGHLTSQCLHPHQHLTPIPTKNSAPNLMPKFPRLASIADKMVIFSNRRQSSTPTQGTIAPPNCNRNSTSIQAKQNYAQGRVNQVTMEEAQYAPTMVPSTFFINSIMS